MNPRGSLPLALALLLAAMATGARAASVMVSIHSSILQNLLKFAPSYLAISVHCGVDRI